MGKGESKSSSTAERPSLGSRETGRDKVARGRFGVLGDAVIQCNLTPVSTLILFVQQQLLEL